MLKEEKQWVLDAIAGEIAKISFPVPVTPKPVDVDGIVKLVLDKIKFSATAAEAPKKGKEK